MKKIAIVFSCILICFVVGFISSRFQVDALREWYPTIVKSSLTPPNFVFPVAWSILYVCMGLSIGLLIVLKPQEKSSLLMLFIAQLVLNFAWSIFFFYFQNPLLGLIDIILLLNLIVLYILKSYSVLKISSWLFIPYAIWVGFATYLNYYIFLNN